MSCNISSLKFIIRRTQSYTLKSSMPDTWNLLIRLSRGSGRNSMAVRQMGKGEDTFGMRDEDWLVYRKMSKDNDDNDDGNDDEESELARITCKNQAMDPTFVNKTEAVQLTPEPPKAWSLTEEDYRISIGIERFCCPEILFPPGMIGIDQAGIDEMVSISLRRLMEDKSVKERLCQSILVTGGCSLLPGIVSRVESGSFGPTSHP